MAIRRTREQKQRAIERRNETFSFTPSRDISDTSDVQLTPRASAVADKVRTTSVFDSGLTKHRELTTSYLKQDLGRIVLTTLALFVVLVGIWYGTRYNGLSWF